MFGTEYRDRLDQTRNFLNHVNGELAIVLEGGPESVQTGQNHHLFSSGRQYHVSHITCACYVKILGF